MKDSRELMADFADLETTYWFYTARLQIMRKLFAGLIEPGELVANVGCGPGATSVLASEFGEVVNLDYSLDALRFTRKRGMGRLACADCRLLAFTLMGESG